MTGINYLDEQLSPIAMRCSFTGCPCRVGCWHLKRAHRMSCNPNFPDDVREAYRGGPPVLIQKRLEMPLHWKQPRRIGVQFMGDLFDEQVRWGHIDDIFFVMEQQATQHTYFVLTKQVKRMYEWANSYDDFETKPNVYLGVSITGQEDLLRIWPDLSKVPGKKWISWEPALGPCTFDDILWDQKGNRFVDLLVMGCESGPKRRPSDPEWFIEESQKARKAGIKVYIKQISLGQKVSHDPTEWDERLQIREMP